MEREELTKVIEEKLIKFEMASLENYKENIKEHFLKIESYIQECERKRNEIYDEYKSLKVNVAVVSKHSKIARQTIYNNKEYLEKYIQFSQKEFEKNDLFFEINRDKESIAELKDVIQKLYDRDIVEQLKLDEVDDLKREKMSLINEVKALSKNNALLQKEIEKMKLKLSGKSNVLNIDTEKRKK